MAKRAVSTALASTALSTAVVIALGSAAGAAPAQDARVSAKLPSAVVAGYLSTESMQASMVDAWNAKVAEFLAAVKAAEEEEARRAAEAAEAARVAAEQQAAAAAAQAQAQAQAVQSQAVQSAPAQSTYNAPVQSYSAPAQSSAAPDYSGASGDVSSWANSGKSMSVKQCESGNNYSTNTGNGYYGAWQFDLPSWHANGGGAYASRPDLAPAWAQDQVAYNYYQNAGWGPWGCG